MFKSKKAIFQIIVLVLLLLGSIALFFYVQNWLENIVDEKEVDYELGKVDVEVNNNGVDTITIENNYPQAIAYSQLLVANNSCSLAGSIPGNSEITINISSCLGGLNGSIHGVSIITDSGTFGGYAYLDGDFTELPVGGGPGAPAGAPILKNVQIGHDILTDTDLYVPLDNSVTMVRSQLFFSHTTNNVTPRGTLVYGELYNTTHLHFAKNTSGPSETNIQWYLAEFENDVAVRRGTQELTSIADDISIAAVNMSSSYVTSSFRNGGSSMNTNDFIASNLTSSTTLRANVGPTPEGSNTYSYEVTQYGKSEIQRGIAAMDSGTGTVSVDITAVDQSKAFVIAEIEALAGDDADSKSLVANFTDSDTIRFERIDFSEDDLNISWQVVEFTGNERVFTGIESFASGETTKSVSLSGNVNISSSVVFFTHGMKGGMGGGATDQMGHVWFTGNLTDFQTLSISRATTGESAWVQWVVVEFDNGITEEYPSCTYSSIQQVGTFFNTTSLDDPNRMVMGRNNILYVASGGSSDSIVALNVSDPTNIVQVDEYETVSNAYAIAFQENVIYAGGLGSTSVFSIDASDPTALSLLDSQTGSGSGKTDIHIRYDKAFISAESDDRLGVWNIADPTDIYSIVSYTSSSNYNDVQAMHTIGSQVYVGAGDTDVSLLTSDTPSDLNRRDTHADATYLAGIQDMEAEGNQAYFASSSVDTVAVVNLTPNSGLATVETLTNSTYLDAVNGIAMAGEDFLIVTSKGTSDAVVIINKSNRMALSITETFQNGSSIDDPNFVVVDGDYAFVSNEGTNKGIVAFNICRYTDTLKNPAPSPPGRAIIKQVYSGAYTKETSAVEFIPIGAEVNVSRSILFSSTSTREVTGVSYGGVLVHLHNSSHLITDKRWGGSTNFTHLTWYVAEFNSGVEVQHNNKVQSYSELHPIEPVNGSSSFVINSFFGDTGNYDERGFIRTFLDPRGAVHTTTEDLSSWDNNISTQTINYKGAKVQRGEYNYSASSTAAHFNISAVNTSKSFILGDGFSGSGWSGARNFGIAMNFTNNTHFGMHRRNSGDIFVTGWQVIEFTGNESVQTGFVRVDNLDETAVIALNSPVNVSRSVAFFQGLHHRGMTNEWKKVDGAAAFVVRFINSTHLDINRSYRHNDDAWPQWVVIEFGD